MLGNKQGVIRSKFDAAKALDLPALCASLESKITSIENGAAPRADCPSCKSEGEAQLFIAPDGIWRWKCKVCSANGSAIDFAAYRWGIPAREAVDRLNRGSYKPAEATARERTRGEVEDQLEAVAAVLRLLQRADEPDAGVVSYLKTALQIPQWVINEAFRRSVLRTLPATPTAAAQWLIKVAGEGLLRDAGFLKPGATIPAIAYRPLVFLYPGLTAAEFRLARSADGNEVEAIRYGAIKWPLWWQGDGTRVLVVEGAVSLLSAVALQEPGHIMGLPSATSWKREWLGQLMARRPNSSFVLGMHEQPVATSEIAAELGRLDIPHEVLDSGCDWNSLLRRRRQQ